MFIKQRMKRAVAALNEFGIDAWITYGTEAHFNTEPVFFYLSPTLPLQHSAIIITKNGDKIVLAGMFDTEEMERYGDFTEIIPVTTVEDFEAKTAAVIKKLQPGKIALNYSEYDPGSDGLTFSGYQRLQRIFSAAGFHGEICSSYMLMKRTKGQKSPEEVAKIAETVDFAMELYDEARGFIRRGLSGLEIQAFFQKRIAEAGAGYSWPKLFNPFVSVGTRSSYMCVRPPKDVFCEPGDVVNVDMGIQIDGFGSDNQRTYYILRDGETSAPEEVTYALETLQEANAAAVAAMAPGVFTGKMLDAANEVFVRRGFPKYSGLGHELGMFAHEGGIKSGGVKIGLDNTLERGMCFTVEPAIITSCGRVCQEEVVTVTADGGKMLSRPQEGVFLIGK